MSRCPTGFRLALACGSTDAPYTFIARIGYYECLHRSQAG